MYVEHVRVTNYHDHYNDSSHIRAIPWSSIWLWSEIIQIVTVFRFFALLFAKAQPNMTAWSR